MKVHEPIGVEVDGLRVDRIGESDRTRLRALLAEHGVVVLRDQDVDDSMFVTFLRGFGALVFTAGETPVDGADDLNVVSNVGRTTPPRSVFHVDTSYVRQPPAYTALRAVAVPEQGGQTLFSNQYRAYDTLPDEVKQRLHGRLVRHSSDSVTSGAGGDREQTSADHPVFRVHPVSGRTALYVSTPARCVAMSGLGQDEATATIAMLYSHSTREDNLFRHAWRPGDVVMWDNGVVLHKADHSGVVGDRVLHRGMVDGYPAGVAASA